MAKLPDNLIGEICHGSCHNHPIVDEECARNSQYKTGIEGWLKIFSRLSVYEYYYKVAALELPFPIVHSIRQDIRYYKDMKFYGLYTQYADNWWTIGLNYYIAARLLWTSEQNVDVLLEDFYKKFYGRAWIPMKAYHECLENAAKRSHMHLVSNFIDLPKMFCPETLKEAEVLLKEAAAIPSSEQVRARIAKQTIVIEYTRRCMDYIRAMLQASEDKVLILRKASSEDISIRFDEHVQGLRSFLRMHKESNCFRSKMSNYVKRFLDPVCTFRYVDRNRHNHGKNSWRSV